MKKVLFLTFILLLGTISLSVHAQSPSSIDGVDISISPENPRPGSQVSVSIESYITDLNSASILWLVDGKTYTKGVGVKSITIQAPNLGRTKTVTTIIQTNEGREVTKALIIKVGDVDIIWESLGMTPPLFKGKSNVAYQSNIKITAIPHLYANGSEIGAKDLVYKWKLGEKVLTEQNGFGRQSVIIDSGNIPKPVEINLVVTSRDGSQSTEGSLSLEPQAPSLLFYEIDPLYGIMLNKELGDRFNLKNSETTVLAVPFGFNSGVLSYVWSINNVEQPDLSKNQSITLRTKGDADGSSNVSLDVRSRDYILQGTNGGFTAIFKKRTAEEDSTTF